MREYEGKLTPQDAFRRRLFYEVERLAGEIEAICVDMQIAAKPRFVDHGTARSIRAIVKDDHFVRVVNKLNLVEQTIKDPGTAERILSDCLTGNGITKWADAQPIDEKERWLHGKAEVMLSNSVFSNINDALLRSMPSENVGAPPYLSKQEGSPFRSRPDDDSEEDQPDAPSPGEVWVRPYKQQRHGKTVSVRGYPRHHTPSQHEEVQLAQSEPDEEPPLPHLPILPPGPIAPDLPPDPSQAAQDLVTLPGQFSRWLQYKLRRARQAISANQPMDYTDYNNVWLIDPNAIDKHHLLPRQFEKFFKDHGFKIAQFLVPMTAGDHRFKPDGIHTGPWLDSWNGQWEQWEKDDPLKGLTPEEKKVKIMEKLKEMIKQFPIIIKHLSKDQKERYGIR